jgi:maltose O-acetyltransferase
VKTTEREKMLAGELYMASDEELVSMRKAARRLLHAYNTTTVGEPEMRTDILKRLFGRVGSPVEIEPPFYCDYGSNIYAGDGLYINFGCVILDCNEVHIGDKVLFGPYVQVYTAYHPTDPEVRKSRRELASSISIGNNVWVGGGAIICGGVTIGENTTIGAGSVVIKDIPPRVMAAGNPCRVIKKL